MLPEWTSKVFSYGSKCVFFLPDLYRTCTFESALKFPTYLQFNSQLVGCQPVATFEAEQTFDRGELNGQTIYVSVQE